MKTDKLRPVALLGYLVLAMLGTLAGFKAQAEPSSASEKARTLQMISPYRKWGRVNQQPIVVQIDQMAPSG